MYCKIESGSEVNKIFLFSKRGGGRLKTQEFNKNLNFFNCLND